jgi:hypothetical protein
MFRSPLDTGTRTEIASTDGIKNDTNPLTQWLTGQNLCLDGIFGPEFARIRPNDAFPLPRMACAD